MCSLYLLNFVLAFKCCTCSCCPKTIVNTAIEKFLRKINVKRQAYHSQSFVGNLVDICFKVISQNEKPIDISDYYSDLYPWLINFNYIILFQANNIKSLCETISETTRTTSPSLLHEATAIQKKFESLLTLFARCHSKYNSSEAVEDTEIDVLGTTTNLEISNFLHRLWVSGILIFCLSYNNVVNRDRYRRVCMFLQDNFSRRFLSSQAPHARGTCYSFHAQMALPSRLLRWVGRWKCPPWICPACINIFACEASGMKRKWLFW